MNITTIIILYNSSIEESSTIQSLLTSNITNINLKVIIWNNGPKPLIKDEYLKFKNIFDSYKIQLSIFENIHNIALSKIYNFFVTKKQFDFFSILDQDSKLSSDFFQNIKNNSDYDVIVPAIYSSGWRTKENSLCFPIYHKSRDLFDKQIFEMGEIESISSGLTISKRLKDRLNENNNQIFNERYALYAIDTCFFIDLKSLSDSIYKGICLGKIDHSLDFKLQNPNKISSSRKLEMEYSKVLNKILYAKKSKLNVFLYLLRKLVKQKYSFYVFIKLVKCLIKHKHPRSSIPITMKQLL